MKCTLDCFGCGEAILIGEVQRIMSSSKLYVGNLPFRVTEEELRDLFGAHGEVVNATIVMDRDTGRPRGFGFIEMSNDDEAQAVIQNLDGKDFMGRSLKVNVAQPRENRPRGGGGGGGRGNQDW